MPDWCRDMLKSYGLVPGGSSVPLRAQELEKAAHNRTGMPNHPPAQLGAQMDAPVPGQPMPNVMQMNAPAPGQPVPNGVQMNAPAPGQPTPNGGQRNAPVPGQHMPTGQAHVHPVTMHMEKIDGQRSFSVFTSGLLPVYTEIVDEKDTALIARTDQRFKRVRDLHLRLGPAFFALLMRDLRSSRPKSPLLQNLQMTEKGTQSSHTEDEGRKRKRNENTPPASTIALHTPASMAAIAQDITRNDSARPDRAALVAQVESPQHQNILKWFRKPHNTEGIYTGRVGND